METDPIAEAITILEKGRPVDTLEDRLARAENFLWPLPQIHQQTHYLVTEDLPFYVLTEAVIHMTGMPDALAIATMGYNRDALEMLGRLVGLWPSLEIDLVAGEEFACLETDLVAQADRDLASRGVRIAYSRNHAKVVAIQCAGEEFYTLEGSGNFRRCKRMENLTITANRKHYDFHTRWIRNLTRQ